MNTNNNNCSKNDDDYDDDSKGVLLKLSDLLIASENSGNQSQQIDVTKLRSVVAEIESDFNGWLQKLNLNTNYDDNNRQRRQQPNDTVRAMVQASSSSSSSSSSEYFDCPYNTQHRRILRKNFERHVNACKLKKSRYSPAEIRDFFKQPNVESSFQIVVDAQTQSSIFQKQQEQLQSTTTATKPPSCSDLLPIPFDPSQVARTSERLSANKRGGFRNQTTSPPTTSEDSRDVAMTSNRYFIDYSTSERLALYDYAIQEAKKRGFVQFKSQEDKVSIYNDDNNQTETSATTSKLSSERSRVRPRSYQTNKAKTHTQVLRELISSQMEHLMIASSNSADVNTSSRIFHHRSRSDRHSDDDDAMNSENGNKRHRSDSSSSKNRSNKKSK